MLSEGKSNYTLKLRTSKKKYKNRTPHLVRTHLPGDIPRWRCVFAGKVGTGDTIQSSWNNLLYIFNSYNPRTLEKK